VADPNAHDPVVVREEYQSAHYKLLRAFDHMTVLEPEIETWRNGDGYEVVTDRDAETGQKTARFRCGEFPPMWGPMIGDILQGLRNALDNIVYGIASACGPLTDTEAGQIAFPVMGAQPLSAGAAKVKMRNVPVPVQDVIKAKQPHLEADYKLTVLWVLHRLANIDKHRNVHLVAFHYQGFQSLPPEGMDHMPIQRLLAGARHARLKDGTVVAEYIPLDGADGPEADVKIQLFPEVIFQEAGLIELPVVAVLHNSGRVVTTIMREIAAAYEGTLPSP